MDMIIIRQIVLPVSIRGMTVMDSEGDYNVYLNSRISRARQLAALEHELEHIRRDHFHDSRPVHELEAEVAGG